jgi:hypothetical protein
MQGVVKCRVQGAQDDPNKKAKMVSAAAFHRLRTSLVVVPHACMHTSHGPKKSVMSSKSRPSSCTSCARHVGRPLQ